MRQDQARAAAIDVAPGSAPAGSRGHGSRKGLRPLAVRAGYRGCGSVLAGIDHRSLSAVAQTLGGYADAD